VICHGCFSIFHFQGKYNVVISGVDKHNSFANNALLDNPEWRHKADDGSHADKIAHDLWDHNCFYGVHVVQRFVDEWTFSDLGDKWR